MTGSHNGNKQNADFEVHGNDGKDDFKVHSNDQNLGNGPWQLWSGGMFHDSIVCRVKITLELLPTN